MRTRFSGARESFTLIEIMIALAIVSITLAAGARAAGVAIDSTSHLRGRTLALWVAQNRMAIHRATLDWPSVGVTAGKDMQGGVKLSWRETVSQTANKDFRRVEIKVYRDDRTEYAAARLIGYLHNAWKDKKTN